MIWWRNVLKCIIKVTNSNVSFVFFQDSVKVPNIGETSRKFHTRLKEHKRDIRVGNVNNALLQHTHTHTHIYIYVCVWVELSGEGIDGHR